MQPTPTETCPIPRRENFLALMRWQYLHEDARTVPLHLLAPAERELKIAAFAPRDDRRDELDRWLRDELTPELKRYEDRRKVERRIAGKLEREGFDDELVESLRSCRKHGDLGALQEEGGTRKIIMWNHKCGQNRFCPDEAREEQMRLAERYPPKIKEWLAERYWRQAQYCVLTWPNIPAGELAFFKREMFRQLVKFLQIKKGKDGVARSKRFPAIRGVLATQEDPLSWRGDWNLHLNLLLLVDGNFPWAEFRAGWFKATRHLFDKKHRGFQVHFKNIKGKTLEAIVRAVLELVKYSAKHITECSHDDQHHEAAEPGLRRDPVSDDDSDVLAAGSVQDDRRAQGLDAPGAAGSGVQEDPRTEVFLKAPGLVDWPGERLHEWHRAGLRFRRTRSYGALFAVKEVEPEKIDKDKVQWIGRVDWNDDRAGYDITINGPGPIDLIPDHNSDRALDQNLPPRVAGPPDPDGWQHG